PLEAMETVSTLNAAVALLSPEQRAAIVLRYYLNLSDDEMSARLDCAPGTVRWRLHAARRRLRQLLPAWVAPGATDVYAPEPNALPVRVYAPKETTP